MHDFTATQTATQRVVTGSATWLYISEINSALSSAGSANEVEVADLSAYEDWGE